MNYSMGFKINGTAIPNPSSFSGKQSDLDTMGERDANGYLHRNKVATKHPLNLEYKNITWDTIQTIGSLLVNDKFTFSRNNSAAHKLNTTTELPITEVYRKVCETRNEIGKIRIPPII